MDLPHFWFALIFLSGIAISEQCTRHGVSCPDYTVIATHNDYEERLYPSLVWISTSGKAKARSEISRKLIKRLYSYIGGENDKGQHLDMMVPVRTTKFPGESENTYIMSIALAPEFQENPPNPTDDLVNMVKEPSKTYFARSFGGMIRDENRWDQEAQTLRNSLGEENAANTTFYFWCVYDSPWQAGEDRLNEIWLLPQQNSPA